MRHRRGFTLIELLVVISIIVVLFSLLIPVASKIRQQAHATSTKVQINSLATVMQSYHGDFGGYPGPVPNGQLRVTGPAGCGITAGITDVTKMSMAENVYLGLCGGLELIPTPPNVPATFRYITAKAGNGPMWMGLTPKKLPKYADNTNVSAGFYKDGNETAALDTEVPEFTDKFPEAMPFLIFRARVGAPGVCGTSNVPTAGEPVPQQYDLQQVASYTTSEIGVGRKLDEGEVAGHTKPNPFVPFHGLRTVNANATLGPPPAPPLPGQPTGLVHYYPYDLYAALIDPTITVQSRVYPVPPATPAHMPRQKDGFIIISAGIDRVYGTEDDIANFDRY